MVEAVGTRWFLTSGPTRQTVDRQHEREDVVEDTHGNVDVMLEDIMMSCKRRRQETWHPRLGHKQLFQSGHWKQ